MTTELERKFFECFEIKKKRKHNYITQYGDTRAVYTDDYPTITDTHYLELICLLGEHDERYSFKNVENLKKTVLNELISYYKWCLTAEFKGTEEWAEELKTQIQSLFKGEQ